MLKYAIVCLDVESSDAGIVPEISEYSNEDLDII